MEKEYNFTPETMNKKQLDDKNYLEENYDIKNEPWYQEFEKNIYEAKKSLQKLRNNSPNQNSLKTVSLNQNSLKPVSLNQNSLKPVSLNQNSMKLNSPNQNSLNPVSPKNIFEDSNISDYEFSKKKFAKLGSPMSRIDKNIYDNFLLYSKMNNLEEEQYENEYTKKEISHKSNKNNLNQNKKVSPLSKKVSPLSKKVSNNKNLKLIKIIRSPRIEKKYRAYFIDGTHTDFGNRGSKNYGGVGSERTLDKIKKENYIKRHQANENWNNPKSAGALSRWVLWNKETFEESVKDYKKRFNL